MSGWIPVERPDVLPLSPFERRIYGYFCKGMSVAGISALLHVSPDYIYDTKSAILGKGWRIQRGGITMARAKFFSEQQKEDIRDMLRSGMSYEAAAKKYNCSVQSIRRLIDVELMNSTADPEHAAPASAAEPVPEELPEAEVVPVPEAVLRIAKERIESHLRAIRSHEELITEHKAEMNALERWVASVEVETHE